jgi:hypothetical protein
VMAMTYLSDKESARVNDVQEVSEAAIEGRLEKEVGERSQMLYTVLRTLGTLPIAHHYDWCPPVLRIPHVGDEGQ